MNTREELEKKINDINKLVDQYNKDIYQCNTIMLPLMKMQVELNEALEKHDQGKIHTLSQSITLFTQNKDLQHLQAKILQERSTIMAKDKEVFSKPIPPDSPTFVMHRTLKS